MKPRLKNVLTKRATKVLAITLILPVLAWSLTDIPSRSELSTHGLQRIIVVQVGFKDLRPSIPRYVLYDLVFSQLDAYVRENSLNRAWIEGDVAQEPVQLDSTLFDYDVIRRESPLYEFRRLAIDAIRSSDKVVDYEEYDRLILVFAGNVSAVWVPDLDAETDDQVTWRQAIVLGEENLSLGVLAHELGHEFGLPDLYADDEIHTAEEAPFEVGAWCIMSYSSASIGMCAWSRIKLVWITPSEVVDLMRGERAIVQLAPTTSPVNGHRALRVKVEDSKYFLVEVRNKAGSDSNIPIEGMLVSLVDESVTPNQVRLQDARPSTETLSDAIFSISTGGRVAFMDQDTGMAIVILGKQDQLYRIHVTDMAEGNAAIRAQEVLREVENLVSRYGYEVSPEALNAVLALLQNGYQEYFEARYGKALELAERARETLEDAAWPEDIRDTFSLIKKIGLRIRDAEMIGFYYPVSVSLLEEATEEYKLAYGSWEKKEYVAAREYAELASSLILKAWFIEFAHPNPNNEEGVHNAFPA